MRQCPKCGTKSIVKNVRDRGNLTKRSRVCTICGRKWQTIEVERWQYENLLKEAGRHDEGREIR